MEYQRRNPEIARKHYLKWVENNRSHLREKSRERYHKNKAAAKTANDKWRKENPDSVRAIKLRYCEKHREALSVYQREWVRQNRGLKTAASGRYRAKRLAATPPCLTPSDLEEIAKCYQKLADFRELIGLDVHVDHVIPLQAKRVCGLHVPWNLRITTASENCSKNNRWSESDAFATSQTFEIAI